MRPFAFQQNQHSTFTHQKFNRDVQKKNKSKKIRNKNSDTGAVLTARSSSVSFPAFDLKQLVNLSQNSNYDGE
ncbi:hypothetical protein ASE92_09920 [Pedobacter sp. Leaf41]|nr:hypothetical protein ASE92_09920 [Pedobacter sp. Leaf41]